MKRKQLKAIFYTRLKVSSECYHSILFGKEFHLTTALNLYSEHIVFVRRYFAIVLHNHYGHCFA